MTEFNSQRERRIVENEGRDDDGDLVYRDGMPHPASGLREIPEPMATALRAGPVSVLGVGDERREERPVDSRIGGARGGDSREALVSADDLPRSASPTATGRSRRAGCTCRV